MTVRNLWIPVLLVATAVGTYLLVAQRSTHGVPPVVAATGEPLSADDLARVLGHHIRKMTIALPKDDYGICVWSECWRKDDPTPQVTLLFSTAIMPLDQAILLFDMPTPGKPEGFFSCNGMSGRVTVDIVGPAGMTAFGAQPAQVLPNDDIDLGIVVPDNKDGSPTGAYFSTSRLTHSTHADATYIFRARFVPGRDALIPTWNGTHVELTKWQK